MSTGSQGGFDVPCLRCGETGQVWMSLADLGSFQCQACEATYTAADAQQVVTGWSDVLTWIATAPTRKKTP